MTGRKDGHFMEDFGGNVAKRFTDTDKFVDPWFRRLSSKHKLLWDWLLCNCDHAGIITVDFEFIEMVLNEKFDDEILESAHFSERIVKIGNFKYFIPKFLRFQYGKLSQTSKIHLSVIARLKEEGILYNDSDSIKDIENNARVIGYPKGMDRLKEKDKDKDKNKEKDKEEEIKSASQKSGDELYVIAHGKAKPDAIMDLYNQTLAGVGKLKSCAGLGSESRKELLNTLQHLPTLAHWATLFNAVKDNLMLTGRSKTVFLASLDWLVKEENALKVLSGKYELPTDAEAKSGATDEYLKNLDLGGIA
jgi:hypothetical protein